MRYRNIFFDLYKIVREGNASARLQVSSTTHTTPKGNGSLSHQMNDSPVLVPFGANLQQR